MRYVAALDQGTTSTRCILFSADGQPCAIAQKEHRQIYPRPGWVEHDPLEILHHARETFQQALAQVGASPKDIAAIGVCNQRETTVVWDRSTGKPLHNAIVWQDTRTADLCAELAKDGGVDRFRARTGLPIATYFSATKLLWLLRHIPSSQHRAENGDVLFGTIDAWLIWNFTGQHVTDVTNASRTGLMNLRTLDWDDTILSALNIPRAMLPQIKPSSHVYGFTREGIPVAGNLGDQQAALFGQTCFQPGEAKNTYGTGCFMLLNTGAQPVFSQHGLLTTVAYQLGDEPPTYALEGAVAIAGALVQWLRDNLGLVARADEIEALAAQVPDNGDVYCVPAFSGLYAPYWREDARGVIVGLTRFATKAHVARAALEATAFQTRDVLEAMRNDVTACSAAESLSSLRVDGGMVRNALLMQFQADILGIPVVRAAVSEVSALGAAYAAGLAVGFWPHLAALRANWRADQTWQPTMPPERRERLYRRWQQAVTRSFGWAAEAS
ncbi:MAG: glycerol kinase GlpK [Thermoflexales bacterium]